MILHKKTLSKIPLLQINHIHKKFGYRSVLKDICFQVEQGECVLLIGNNGAGKSTLLRIISSLMRATQGQLLFKGINYYYCHKKLRKSIGYISHESRLYEDLTAFENLKLSGALYGVKRLSFLIEQALDKVDLSYAAHLPVRTFSSGMKKRVAIAKFMLYEPELLILDEPYTGLDQKFIELFQQYLRKYHEQGCTILLVTHQFSLGLELATRGLILRHNQLDYDVPVSEMNLDQCKLWLEQE